MAPPDSPTPSHGDRTDEHLYNSRNMKVYLEYLNHYHPDIDIDEILKYAGVTKYEVEDPAHFFSQLQVDRFHEIIVEQTGNPVRERQVEMRTLLPAVYQEQRDEHQYCPPRPYHGPRGKGPCRPPDPVYGPWHGRGQPALHGPWRQKPLPASASR